jgi:hypothetical protein
MEETKDTIQRMCRVAITEEPEINERDLLEYKSRMRVFGLEKFNGPSFIAAINFYKTQNALEKNDAMGAIVLHVEEEAAGKLIKGLKRKGLNEDDDDAVLDVIAEIGQKIAEQFNKKLASHGYKPLVLSDPIKAKNDIASGIPFSYKEYKYCEISFQLWKNKAIAMDVTMAPA